MIVLNERHLRWLMKEYVLYYHDDRTHLALGKKLLPVVKQKKTLAKVVGSFPCRGSGDCIIVTIWLPELLHRTSRFRVKDQPREKRVCRSCETSLTLPMRQIRDHKIAFPNRESPPKIATELKDQVSFAPGWHFGEAQDRSGKLSEGNSKPHFKLCQILIFDVAQRYRDRALCCSMFCLFIKIELSGSRRREPLN